MHHVGAASRLDPLLPAFGCELRLSQMEAAGPREALSFEPEQILQSTNNNEGGPPVRPEESVGNVTPCGWSVSGGPPVFYTAAIGKTSRVSDEA